jgi:hypothetical protein
MNQTRRILAVTAGLIAGGALFGAIAAVVALAIAISVTGRGHEVFDGHMLGLVAGVGAVFGGILFPTAGFVVLRRVPLWLALLGTLVGTVGGGVAGWVVPGHEPNHVINAIIGALIGFLMATILLRLTVGRPAHRDAVRVPVG